MTTSFAGVVRLVLQTRDSTAAAAGGACCHPTPGAKYGADMPEVPGLLQLAQELGLQVGRDNSRG